MQIAEETINMANYVDKPDSLQHIKMESSMNNIKGLYLEVVWDIAESDGKNIPARAAGASVMKSSIAGAEGLIDESQVTEVLAKVQMLEADNKELKQQVEQIFSEKTLL